MMTVLQTVSLILSFVSLGFSVFVFCRVVHTAKRNNPKVLRKLPVLKNLPSVRRGEALYGRVHNVVKKDRNTGSAPKGPVE